MSIIDLSIYQLEFMQELAKQGKSANTIKNYRTDLNIFKKFLASKGRLYILNEVKTTEVLEYGKFLNDKYNSPNSIRRRVQALRIFFDYLIAQGICDENPIKKMLVAPKVVDLPKPTPHNTVIDLFEYLSLQVAQSRDFEQLLAQRNLVLFALIYGCGLKVSDVERVDAAHVFLQDQNSRIIITPDKRDPYTVVIPQVYEEEFEKYFSMLESFKKRDRIDFEQLLFNANPFKILSGGLSSRGIEVIFKHISGQLKTPITAKELRQACIFKWMVQGVRPTRIKEWMNVQPQYSLTPYQDLLEGQPQKYSYQEV